MKNIKILFLSLFICIFSITLLNAAEPLTKEGNKSIFYGFNGLSELSVDNSYLGVKYNIADKMAVWGAVGFSLKNDEPSENTKEIKNSDFEIDLGFIYYMFQKGPVACYVSPQFGIGFGSTENPEEVSYTKQTTNMFFVGASIGVEWWFTENLSLAVHSFLGYETSTTKNEYPDKSEDEHTNSIFGIIPSTGPNFLLTFYF